MSNFKVGDRVDFANGLDTGTITKLYKKSAWIEWDSGDFDGEFDFNEFKLIENSQTSDLPKYVLVEAKKDEFLQQVNELIAQGYKPQGGVVVDQAYYIQALVLNEPC